MKVGFKKILLLFLLFVILLPTISYSVNIVDDASNLLLKHNYSEDESEHIAQHRNADIQQKYKPYIFIMFISLILINIVTFSIIAIKNHNIFPYYWISLLLILTLYITCNIVIKIIYPSDLFFCQ